MSTGVLCASLGSRVIAGARLLSLVPSCSLQWKINDSFVQFTAIRVQQAYSHLRTVPETLQEPNLRSIVYPLFTFIIVGPTLKQ